jgi:hypothetical protein
MPRAVYGPDAPKHFPSRQDSKKTQTNNGVCEKTGRSEIRICLGDDFVEPRNSLVNLRADATNEEVAKRRKFTEKRSRPVLLNSVCLG